MRPDGRFEVPLGGALALPGTIGGFYIGMTLMTSHAPTICDGPRPTHVCDIHICLTYICLVQSQWQREKTQTSTNIDPVCVTEVRSVARPASLSRGSPTSNPRAAQSPLAIPVRRSTQQGLRPVQVLRSGISSPVAHPHPDVYKPRPCLCHRGSQRGAPGNSISWLTHV